MMSPVTMERFEELLDAYGAAPERWPDAEREPAERLLEQSAAARALWHQSADLDRLLDTEPAASPSPGLAARVLAAAPPRRPRRIWRRVLVAAVPLAAAASVALWFAGDREPVHQVADTAAVEVGEYGSPTDVLLGAYTVDVSATVPSVGCSDSELGCPKVDGAVEPYSGGQFLRRSFA
jgi:hypothetical protein